MARPLRIEYEGAYYHIIQRGNRKAEIFLTDYDKKQFYNYLSIMHNRYATKIHTYCLMNNHYHLILETKEANLSKAMHYLNTAYTMYFNSKRQMSGHLFQGRYKSILIEADEYLHHLSRYIHLNPKRTKLVNDPKDYADSSYLYYVTNNIHPKWLETSFILNMFAKDIKKSKKLYKNFVLEGMDDAQQIVKNNITAGAILGSQDFLDKIKDKFIHNKKDKEIPVLEKLRGRPSVDFVKYTVRKKITTEKMCRNISIYLIRKYTKTSLKDIASQYEKISDAGVSALYNRIEVRRLKDKQLDRTIKEIEEMLKIET